MNILKQNIMSSKKMVHCRNYSEEKLIDKDNMKEKMRDIKKEIIGFK